MTNVFLAAFLSAGVAPPLLAQVDTSFVTIAQQNVIEEYDRYFVHQSALFNGSEYQEPLQTNDTHPFYRSLDWQPAEVSYDGITFKEVHVLCDLYHDNSSSKISTATKFS